MANTFTKGSLSHTAVWGGALGRMLGLNDKWLGIPTGHMTANALFGTTTSEPDASYTTSSTADDLLGVIWTPCSAITVTACRIIYGEGGGTNITHRVSLMRYDMDADGDLSNGHDVGDSVALLNSDDYNHIRSTNLTIDSDNTVSTSQVLIGMIMCNTNVNSVFTAKCILEYR